jgi:fermentation-respiration switch protein FrsA (DUF1100 family)
MSCHGMLIISGGADSQVPPEDMKQLIDRARARGADIWEKPTWMHAPSSPADERLISLMGYLRDKGF